ncbi:pectinesterase 2-like [Cornus florida]|uniref:pectinesterase 2-like n=1 Tax=Cornus florida TaxID=4283 RepID=UPI00289F4566|nr:pectinesterase 2-like [Cornus florida]
MTMSITIEAVLVTILLTITIVISDDTVLIPADKSQVKSWYQNSVKPYKARKHTLDPALMTAESHAKVIKVRKDGKGDFKTVTDAVKSIPDKNTRRIIVWIGGGNYTEKIRIDRNKPFVTFYGSPNDMPTLVYDDTAKECGTVDSATLIVESDYFIALNLIIVNSAPRPDGKREGAQAVSLRISGDKAAFYNCKVHGFQDTICDDRGKHFFQNCYIEGTVDFIFGNGRSLYLNTELHVLPGENIAIVTAQARESSSDSTGYSFVHCNISGSGSNIFLGRAWRTFSRVVYAYTHMSNVVTPQGWSDHYNPQKDNFCRVFFGEYMCTGPGSNTTNRAEFSKKLRDVDVKPFICLGFIEGSKWLLPLHMV